MKNAVFWDVTLCGSCKNQRFGGTYRFHHQGKTINELGILALNAMKYFFAACFSC
jgi:hypothetical protein